MKYCVNSWALGITKNYVAAGDIRCYNMLNLVLFLGSRESSLSAFVLKKN